MKKGLFLLLLALAALSGVCAVEQSALVKSFSGKVEYRTGNSSWKPVNEGLKIPLGSTISTGFDSKTVLEIGTATLSVAALTRMAITDLVEQNGVVSTKLNLQIGKVKTQVKKVEGIQNNFIIKSPVTTASVRGTIFDFDPVNLTVEEGIVLITDQYNQSLLVHKRESSVGRDAGEILGGSAEREANMLISWNTAGMGGPQTGAFNQGMESPSKKDSQFGSATIRWVYSPNLN